MAESKAKPGKRRVRNPETFRERAQKAAEASGKPAKSKRLRTTGTRAAGPVRRTAQKAAGSKPLRPLRKPARIVGKIVVPSYFRSSWTELKQVTWPSWQQSRRLTAAVFIFAIIFGLIVAGVDWVLDRIFKELILS